MPHILGTMPHIFGTMPHIFGTMPHIFGTMPHIFGTMLHIFGTMPHIFGTMPHKKNFSRIIRIGREIQCLPYVGFLSFITIWVFEFVPIWVLLLFVFCHNFKENMPIQELRC